MQMRTDRSLARSEDRGDLVEGVARVVVKNDRGSLPFGEQGERLDQVVRFGTRALLDIRACEALTVLQVGRSDAERDLPDPRNDVADRGFGSEGASEGLSDGFTGDVSIARVGKKRVVEAIAVIAVDLLYVGAWSHSGPLCHAILSVGRGRCFTRASKFLRNRGARTFRHTADMHATAQRQRTRDWARAHWSTVPRIALVVLASLVLAGCGLLQNGGDDDDYEARLEAWRGKDYPLYKWTVVSSEPVFGPFRMEILVRDGVPTRAYSNDFKKKLKIEGDEVDGRPGTIDALIEYLVRYAPDAKSVNVEWTSAGYPSKIEIDHSDAIDDEVTFTVEEFIPLEGAP